MTFPPEFTALMAQYRDTAAGLGRNHPIARRLWLLVEEVSPEWFREEMRTIARDMNLLPDTWGYDDDGERLYSVDDVAAKVGKSREEVQRDVEQMIAERKALGLPTDGFITDGRTIHRMQ